MPNGKRKTYYKLYGKIMVLEKIYTIESRMLRHYLEGEYGGVVATKIQSHILEKTLDFCKQRAEIKIMYAHDENLLQDKLKIFDSDFRTKYQNHEDAFGLVYAAARLDIKSLYDLLFEDVFHMIEHKTPEEIKTIFPMRYHNGKISNGNDHLLVDMTAIMRSVGVRWALKYIN